MGRAAACRRTRNARRALDEKHRLHWRGARRVVPQALEREGDDARPEAVTDQVDPQVGVGLVELEEQRPEAEDADVARPLFHLPVRRLAQRLLGVLPQPSEVQAGRTAHVNRPTHVHRPAIVEPGRTLVGARARGARRSRMLAQTAVPAGWPPGCPPRPARCGARSPAPSSAPESGRGRPRFAAARRAAFPSSSSTFSLPGNTSASAPTTSASGCRPPALAAPPSSLWPPGRSWPTQRIAGQITPPVATVSGLTSSLFTSLKNRLYSRSARGRSLFQPCENTNRSVTPVARNFRTRLVARPSPVALLVELQLPERESADILAHGSPLPRQTDWIARIRSTRPWPSK